MLDLDKEFEMSLLDYEYFSKTININNSLSVSELEIIDKLLFSFITKKWQKTAFIIGQAFIDLNQLKEIAIFKQFPQDIDVLLCQRLYFLSEQKKIESNGDVRAMRFSELKI